MYFFSILREREEESREMATPPPTSMTTMTTGKFRRILLSNMESFLVHTMPLVRLCEKENNKNKKDFTLKSLWEAFHETSAFGCEVPLEMNANKERIEKEEDVEENEEPEVIAQYYASYVSAFQIFEKTKKNTKKTKKKRREERRKNGVGESRSDDYDDDFKEASAQYFESLAPYSRPPLTDVIERLAEENEKVQSLKASEIDREKSWFCFAWYPIYRIPQGTSRSDIQGCFLTYHGLNHLDIEDEEDEEEDGDESGKDIEEEDEEEEEEEEEKVDKDGSQGDEEVEHGEKNGKTSRIRGLPPLPPASLTLAGETRLQRRIEDAKKSVAVLEKDERSNTTTTTKGIDVEHTNFTPLKPFGLCCYKTDPEIWEESDEAENARTAAMIDGAYAFLRSLEVIHPDYEFFSHHG